MTKQPNQTLLRRVLNEQFEKRRLKNPSYSIRAFSQRLGVSHSALSEIMGGKRKVGEKLGQRLAEGLMLEPDAREALFTVARKNALQSERLQADQYRVIADWFHFAILSLAETKPFKSDPAWIAKRLGITPTQARDAIQRLCRLKLMRMEKSGLKITGQSFASPDGIHDLAVRKTHHQYLEMAQAALERNQVDERDFTAITMAIDPEKLTEAKLRLRAFRDELCLFLESGRKTQVFELCLQLFPLSKEV